MCSSGLTSIFFESVEAFSSIHFNHKSNSSLVIDILGRLNEGRERTGRSCWVIDSLRGHSGSIYLILRYWEESSHVLYKFLRNENGFGIVVIIDKRISIHGIFVLFVCTYYNTPLSYLEMAGRDGG